MPYLCKNCGEKESFETGDAYREVTAYVTEYGSAIIDQHGDIEDFNYYSEDRRNEDITEEGINDGAIITCCNCGQEAELVSDEEWDNFDIDKPVEKKEGKIDKLKKEIMGGEEDDNI